MAKDENPSPLSDSSSSTTSLKPPRTPRFAEATSVYSPIDAGSNPFTQRGPAGDIGFGYIGPGMEHDAKAEAGSAASLSSKTGFKSALRSPGTPRRMGENPLSPTFRQEDLLEKREQSTSKAQKKDLAIKARVRMAKFALRGVNFSCSLIIIAMLSTTFAIFNATKALPARGVLTSWAPNSKTWPQMLVLSMACVSLAATIIVFAAYCRGGHRRAEKVATYYTLFAIGWFILSMVLWAITAALFQHSRDNSGNKDLWGWSCAQNKRAATYSDDVAFALVCRLNNWALICIVIEIVVEAICISLYSIVFYRYWSKRRLRKTMDSRDKARSDLYLAQLRSQSAPNTPGFSPGGMGGPKSPALSQYPLSPRFPPKAYRNLGDIEVSPFTPRPLESPRTPLGGAGAGFKLQAPPSKAPSATPRSPQSAFASSPIVAGDGGNAPRASSPQAPANQSVQQHAPVADDEPQYAAVTIPGAYADAALKSPPSQDTFGTRRA